MFLIFGVGIFPAAAFKSNAAYQFFYGKDKPVIIVSQLTQDLEGSNTEYFEKDIPDDGWQTIYDEAGNLIRLIIPGPAEQPEFVKEWDKDADRLKVTQYILNSEGNIVPSPKGYTFIVSYYYKSGKPSQITFSLDEGKPLEVIYLDENDITTKSIVYHYDENGNFTPNEQGFSIKETELYPSGEEFRVSCYAEEGVPLLIVEYAEDGSSSQALQYYYDKAGKLSLNEYGYAISENTEDENENPILRK